MSEQRLVNEQGVLIPNLPPVGVPAVSEASMLQDLNKAKALAWQHAADAVEVLAKVMVDPELYDTEVRVQAAAELLQFAAKGPF